MNIDKLKSYIIFVAVFFSWVSFASANLEISNIMYDPEGADTNREWVELYNNGNESITIVSGKSGSAWRLGDGPTGETLHYINDTLTIAPGESAILASDKDTYLSEYSYSGEVADTSMSLNNTSGIVTIWDGSDPRNVIVSKSYSSSDTGESEEVASGDENNTNDAKDDLEPTQDNSTILKITTKIISPKIVVARTPFSFNSLTTTNRGQTYATGKWVWNFGDGMTSQVIETGPFAYVYEYPGEYALTLSYFDNSFTLVPDATDKIIIKVIESEVYISAVGDNGDPFVEIENQSKYEVDLSGWIVTAGTHYFKIPEGTILLPDKKIKLSPKITGFTSFDLASIVITNPNKFVIATYPVQIKQFKVDKIDTNGTTPESDKVYINNKASENSPSDDSEIINLNDLGASASGAKVNISKTVYSLVGLLLIIGLGVTSFLLIKKKNNTPDYVEKQIRAEDMTIIE
ncbi:MAG: lamin tail domain-containing protein [Candidatus Paceibacterota bacterium]|jgi:hypothetical protein